MSPHTLIVTVLAVSLGFAFPSWAASIARFQCVPGAYLADSEDCTRYYQCIGDGSSIRALSCPEGTHFCGGSDQQCCDEPIDPEVESELFDDGSDVSTMTNFGDEQATDVNDQQEDSDYVKIYEDERPFEFVGQRFPVSERKEGLGEDTNKEYDVTTTEHITHYSIYEEPASGEVLEDEIGSTGRVEFDNANSKPGDEPINVSGDNEDAIHDSISSEGPKGNVSNEFTENTEMLNVSEANEDDMTVFNEPEESISGETLEKTEVSELKESSSEDIYRNKRSAEDAGQEDAPTTEEANKDSEKKKKSKNNQDSSNEASTDLSTKEDGSHEDQSLPITYTTGEPIGEQKASNENNESLSPEYDEDNLKSEILDIPSPDNSNFLNASAVQVDSGSSLNSKHDFKIHRIIDLVKQLLSLTDDENESDLQTTLAP